MIRSMTGYGRGDAELENQRFVVEIKSVNHRYSDIYVRLPKQFSYLEEKIKSVIKKYISRGKVDVYISCDFQTNSGKHIEVDHSFADALISALNSLKDKYKIAGKVTLDNLMSFPEIFKINEDEQNQDEIWETANIALQQALNELIEMRCKEGSALAEDLKIKVENILKIIDDIERYSEQMLIDYRQQLYQRLKSLCKDIKVDPERIETEVVLFADKCSVDEEIIRIKSHIRQFSNNLREDEPIGRKLEFLLQEINREINTIGSKSNNIKITENVVEVKTELEKIREQVQNIE